MVKKKCKILSLAIVLAAFTLSHAMPAGSRITLPGGKKIFVSGMNLAWKNFANDVGDVALDETYFKKAFKDVADSGGNCMRVWLSTNGTNDPKYGTDGLVKGPGSQTITNIQKMLKIAKDNNMLLMPVLMTHNFMELSLNSSVRANNKKLLQTEAGLQAYIDNYLVPVVTAIGNDPNLICWEIFNEAEGMVTPWSNLEAGITQKQIQRANNWIAAAIKTVVPGVLVSTGTVTTGELPWYTDAALKAEGGKANGTLDFYMAHYYGWNGTGSSPFTKNYSYWKLDKPLVIGEYPSSDWTPTINPTKTQFDAGKVDTLLIYLNKAGYAGGLGWQYQQDGGDAWLKGYSTFAHSIAQAYRADSNSIKLDGAAANSFAVMASAGSGGTVKASASGRIDSGKPDTLTATAMAGYTFTGWTGDTTSALPILVITGVTKDWVLQANFTPAAGTNLIKGGDFTDGSLWGFYAAEENTADVKFTSEQATVTVTKADSLNYHIQFTQGSIGLDSGVTYLLTFDGWSTGERTLYIGFSTEGTWHFQGGTEKPLTATKTKIEVEVTPDSSTSAGILQFNCGGGSLLPVYIDNVTLVRKPGVGVVAGHAGSVSSSVTFARSADVVRWSAPSSQASASLMDLRGRVIMANLTMRTVNIATAPAGAYLFVVKNGQSSQVFRFTK